MENFSNISAFNPPTQNSLSFAYIHVCMYVEVHIHTYVYMHILKFAHDHLADTYVHYTQ